MFPRDFSLQSKQIILPIRRPPAGRSSAAPPAEEAVAANPAAAVRAEAENSDLKGAAMKTTYKQVLALLLAVALLLLLCACAQIQQLKGTDSATLPETLAGQASETQSEEPTQHSEITESQRAQHQKLHQQSPYNSHILLLRYMHLQYRCCRSQPVQMGDYRPHSDPILPELWPGGSRCASPAAGR